MATVSQIDEAVYRARFDDQMSAGAASAERALNSLGTAVVATDEKVTRATRSSEAWVRSADPVTAAANRAAAAQRNLSAAQEALSADLQAGGERAMAAQRALDALAAKAQSAAAAAKQLETAHVQAQVAIHGMAPAATAASSGYSRLSQAVGQAGFQVQDFFVQVGAGQSALVAFAQQGSQLLGVFGTFGAVAGAALAIGALAAQFAIGKTEAEKFKDALDAQEASYQATLTEAERMQNALRRQGDQYLSAEQAGARYRAGLQGEGENLVRLIDYYGRLTAAQRQAEQVSISAQRVALTSNSDALRREVLSGVSGRIGVAEGGPAFDAGTGTPNLVATNLQALSAGYREATDAALKFRDAGVISVAAFSELLNAVNQARQVGGAENVVLREYEESLIRLLPQVRQYETAMRQLNTAQQALADNGGPQAQVERMRGVVADVGGRYQSRQQIRDQRGNINAGLQSGAATAEDIARARSSLEALAEAERGLISPIESALRGLREQVAVARELEGADRAVAQAMLQVQQAGGGMAAQLEAGRLVMARLNEEFRQGNEALIRNAQGLTAQRNAFGQGATAVDDARLAAQAYAEVTRQLGRAVNEESQEYQTRLALLQDERNIRAEIASAQTVDRQGQQLEILRRETELVGASVAVRERELAVLRERQAILNTPGADINSETSQQRLANAATISNATQQLQRQRTAYDELARVGEQAFDRIGSAITQAFANGGIRAINFGNIAKAVFSEVIQAGLRLAVINPIVNSVFGGNRATLGSISDLAGGSGGASGGGFSLSSASSLFSNGRSILSGGGLGSFFPGGSAINTGFGFLDAGLNASTGIGSGSALANATATYGEGIGSFATQGITQASGAAASGLSVAQLLGPAAAIGGGLYGVYSGIQRGGVGGYTGAAGGAISAATGIGMLGSAAGLLPALGALGPIGLALGAALALAGAFMPGAQVSGKGQEVNFNTLNGAKTTYGLGGDRFSQGNQDYASQLAGGVAQLESALQDKLGFGIDTSIGAGVTSGRKKGDPGTLYLRVGEQRAQFGNDEAGAKAFGETAGRFLLDEFKRVGAAGDKGSILRNSGSIEDLGKNLDWYESTYKALTGVQAQTTQFAESLRTLVKPYDDAIGKAQQLELATDALTKKRGEELEKVLEPMLRTGLAAETYSDGLKAVRENYEAVIRVAGELGRSTDDLTAAMGRAAAKFRADAQRGFDSAVRAASGQSYIDQVLAVRDNWNANATNYLAAGRDPNALYAAQLSSVLNGLDFEQLGKVIDAMRGVDDVAVLFAETLRSGIVAADKLAKAQAEAAKAAEAAADQQIKTAEALRSAINAGGAIRAYLDQLNSTGAGGLSPQNQLANAQSIFSRDLTLSRGGDLDALGRITGSADNLLAAGRGMFASGSEFQALLAMVNSSLGSLPAVKSWEQQTLDTLTRIATGQQTAVQLLGILSADVNNDQLITWPEFTTWGKANAEQTSQLAKALGVSNGSLADIFTKLDTNGDGTLTKLEIQNALAKAANSKLDDVVSGGTGTQDKLSTQNDLLTQQNTFTKAIIDLQKSIADSTDAMAAVGKLTYNGTLINNANLKAANSNLVLGNRYAAATAFNTSILTNLEWSARGGEGNPGIPISGEFDENGIPISGKFAEGGIVTNGRYGEDSVYAKLAGGEMIVPANDVAANLAAIRSVNIASGNEATSRMLDRLAREIAELRAEMRRVAGASERTADATEETAATNAAMARREVVVGRRAAA